MNIKPANAQTRATKADNQGALSGRVFIVDQVRWERSIEPELNRTLPDLSAYVYQAGVRSIAEHYDHRLATLDSVCSENCAFQGNFSVQRNGVIDIYIDEDVKTADDAPRLPNDPLSRQHVRHILAAQLFSFIRDIGHQHQHHSPRTDTIVDLHEIQNEDDLMWRRHTLYGIYRRIISYKRRSDIERQIMSLGLLRLREGISPGMRRRGYSRPSNIL